MAQSLGMKQLPASQAWFFTPDPAEKRLVAGGKLP